MFDAHRVSGELFAQGFFVAVHARFGRIDFVAVRAEFDDFWRFVELPYAQFVVRDGEAVYRPELEGSGRFGVVLEFGLALQERQDVVAAKVVLTDLFVAQFEFVDDFDAQGAV